MTTAELIKEVQDLKRRVDLAETRLGQVEGRFEFVSGQLRDMQLYMHAKFAEMDQRLDRIEADVKGLRNDLPGMMRDVMREVLAEQRKA